MKGLMNRWEKVLATRRLRGIRSRGRSRRVLIRWLKMYPAPSSVGDNVIGEWARWTRTRTGAAGRRGYLLRLWDWSKHGAILYPGNMPRRRPGRLAPLCICSTPTPGLAWVRARVIFYQPFLPRFLPTLPLAPLKSQRERPISSVHCCVLDALRPCDKLLRIKSTD